MPRVAGLNVVAVLAAAVAMFFVGFLFYGVIFQQLWMQNWLVDRGMVLPGQAAQLDLAAMQAQAAAAPGRLPMGPAMGLGFVVSLLEAIGVATLLQLARPASLAAAVRTVVVAWIGFSVPMLAYNIVYSGESRVTFGIDLAHTFVAFALGAIVVWLIDGKRAAAS